jgi:hypothetical protein
MGTTAKLAGVPLDLATTLISPRNISGFSKLYLLLEVVPKPLLGAYVSFQGKEEAIDNISCGLTFKIPR